MGTGERGRYMELYVLSAHLFDKSKTALKSLLIIKTKFT